MDKIIILDFGGQTTQLIGRRIREAGIYTEVYNGEVSLDSINLRNVRGFVFSGSPFSVYDSGSPRPDERIYSSGLPILGICYGLHIIMDYFGGRVESHKTKEYGRAGVISRKKDKILSGIPDSFISWMSHGDSIVEIGDGFEIISESDNHPAIIFNKKAAIYGFQFHPEVSHCEFGSLLLENFAHKICGAKKEWDIDIFLEKTINKIRNKITDSKVLLLISGGVDSTVAAGLLLKALPPENIHLMYIDTGLMRKDESKEVEEILKTLGARNLHIIDAGKTFLSALKNITDPEEKRKIIGDLFIRVQEEEIKKLHISNYFLAQGTLYTDLIESGKGVGNKAKTIKSHHNVNSPLVEKMRKEGRIVEPLDIFYKDEVRQLGKKLGISNSIIRRHPFPGPGLGVRIPGEITKEKCDILRDADRIFIDEIKKRNLYDRIWQAFCVLLPVRSVGVTGDSRNYSYVLALRAITSLDGMTADVYPFKMSDLLEISSIITNSVEKIGRVVYDISSKPPSTIEWE